MAQCKKILDNDEQCSNRAVPGTEYCEQHRRIQFRRVPKKPGDTKAPAEEPSPEETQDEAPAEPPSWVAQPSAAGETPAFPGLRPDDERNILVAPEALIWLSEERVTDETEELFKRLARSLGRLSQEISLPGQVTVRTVSKGAGYLVSLRPSGLETADLSRLYDVASAAAALSGGLMYIGEKRLFIQYRDGEAPRGYDAKDVKPPRGNALYLVDYDGTHSISPRSLTEESLGDVLLRIPPLPERGVELPEVAFALVAPPLYSMLAKYFRSHHLRYRVARFHASNGDTLILFEIAPCPNAPPGALVPAFVLSYLSDLPRCVVLTEVEADAGRRLLVEYGHRYPCRPRNILDAFPSDCLLLFMTGPDFPNLCISPTPTFFQGDELISAKVPRPTQTELAPVAGQKDLEVELPVRLTHDPGPTPSTAALILDAREREWMRRLVYRLPGEAFDAYQFCFGQERAVLLGVGMAVESLPFGIPLRRVQDTQLFIPLRARLTPELPWKLLADVLEIKESAYTFLTPEFRLDVPCEEFTPLSRALVAEPGRPRVEFEVRSAPALPALNWTPPPKPEAPAEPPPTSQQGRGEKKGVLQRVLQSVKSEKVQPRDEPAPVQEKSMQAPEEVFRKQAESYRQEEDYLSAALCFALAGDNVNAARCYQETAKRVKS